MKWMFLIWLTLTLAACSSLDLSDIVTGAGATGAAVVAATVTSNPVVIAGITAGGAIAGGIAMDDAPLKVADYGGADGEINSFYELMTFAIANFMQHMVGIGILLVVIWFLTGYLGMRKRRPEEKQLQKQQEMLLNKIGKMRDF